MRQDSARKERRKEKVCKASTVSKRAGQTDNQRDAGWRGCLVYEKAVKNCTELTDYELQLGQTHLEGLKCQEQEIIPLNMFIRIFVCLTVLLNWAIKL